MDVGTAQILILILCRDPVQPVVVVGCMGDMPRSLGVYVHWEWKMWATEGVSM